MILLALLAIATTIYLFIRFIVKADRGSKEPLGALFAAMGFGVAAALVAGELNNIVIPQYVIEMLDKGDTSGASVQTLMFSALGVGVIEETLKAVPLAIFLYKKKYFNELTDGVIYFGIAGLTFGAIEDVSYSLQYGGAVGLSRVLFSPYLHAGFSAIIGVYLIQKKLLKKPWLLVGFGYIAAVLAHAIYDFAAFTSHPLSILVLIAVTLTTNIMLFVFFKKAQKIDEQHGMSAIGVNKYCRSCGFPNPERYLYCLQCGKYT